MGAIPDRRFTISITVRDVSEDITVTQSGAWLTESASGRIRALEPPPESEDVMTNEQPLGSLPPTGEEPVPVPKSRRKLWIAAGAVGGVLLLGGINAAARGGSTDAASAPPPSQQQQQQPAAAPQVPETIQVPDVKGLTVDQAIRALEAAELEGHVASDSEDDAPVLSTTPAAGTSVSAGSSVAIFAEERPQLTLGQQNAISKAQDYLSFMPFSRKGLIEQLKFEGFTSGEAKFAVDYISPDWNEQAAAKAQEYLDIMAFSRQGLIEQLMFEGFSRKQAEYGVKAVGY